MLSKDESDFLFEVVLSQELSEAELIDLERLQTEKEIEEYIQQELANVLGG